MIVLACETSTLLGSVAVVEDGKVLANEESPRQGSHSDTLNGFIEKVLQKAGLTLANIDLFASGVGPGSFTGIRISLNTIKTFGYCFNRPVAGIDSLTNLAYENLFRQNEASVQLPVVSMINAYKNMIYIAKHTRSASGGLTELSPPAVIRVQQLQDYITESVTVCGDAYEVYEKYFPADLKQKLLRSPRPHDNPTAVSLGMMASNLSAKKQIWSELLPLYIRQSEAEENLKGIKYQPLF